jgi:hypothetical protein
MATIAADSASRADVATAIAAASSGDTVTIPAGTETWASRITADKPLTIIGNGVGSTVITDYGFFLPSGTANNSRISAIEFLEDAMGAGEACILCGDVRNTAIDGFRLDHLKFTGYPRPLRFWGWAKGVVDNCTFFECTGDGVSVMGANTSAWTRPMGWGGADFVFFEDCTFDLGDANNTQSITGDEGARYVVRHCTFEETGTGTSGNYLDLHGYFQTDVINGMILECYDNTFIKSNANWGRGMTIWGGSAVVHDNVFDTSSGNNWGPPIRFLDYRACKNAGCQFPNVDGVARFCPVADGGEGYRCHNQVGTDVDGNLDPVYIWGNVNHLSASLTSALVTVDDTNGGAAYITEGTDYVFSTRPAYTEYTYPHPLRGEGLSPYVRIY